jgi:aspartyl-tRNA(Asn)/glutamyl-tRNA(Gln) amidotransferase subunit C
MHQTVPPAGLPTPSANAAHAPPMSIDSKQVQRIALLARLAVSEGEIDAVRDKLNAVLGLIEQMQAVDTNGVEPMAHAQDVIAKLREDVVSEADQRERFQALAPQADGGLYLVPRVIE